VEEEELFIHNLYVCIHNLLLFIRQTYERIVPTMYMNRSIEIDICIYVYIHALVKEPPRMLPGVMACLEYFLNTKSVFLEYPLFLEYWVVFSTFDTPCPQRSNSCARG
jgi:hypothetical protein